MDQFKNRGVLQLRLNLNPSTFGVFRPSKLPSDQRAIGT
jgi:hypothetical protein